MQYVKIIHCTWTAIFYNLHFDIVVMVDTVVDVNDYVDGDDGGDDDDMSFLLLLLLFMFCCRFN